jgi:hypothetical protein
VAPPLASVIVDAHGHVLERLEIRLLEPHAEEALRQTVELATWLLKSVPRLAPPTLCSAVADFERKLTRSASVRELLKFRFKLRSIEIILEGLVHAEHRRLRAGLVTREPELTRARKILQAKQSPDPALEDVILRLALEARLRRRPRGQRRSPVRELAVAIDRAIGDELPVRARDDLAARLSREVLGFETSPASLHELMKADRRARARLGK